MKQTLHVATKRWFTSWSIIAIAMMLFGAIHSYAQLTQPELDAIKSEYFFFQNRYYVNNVWDCQRIPADAIAGTSWKLYQFKATEIDFLGNPGGYVKFNIVNYDKNATYEGSDIDKLPYITDDDGNKLVITLDLYNASDQFVKTTSNWGQLQGVSKDAKGVFYNMKGSAGTFCTMDDYDTEEAKLAGVTYTPTIGIVTTLKDLSIIQASWTLNSSKNMMTSSLRGNSGSQITINVTESNDKLTIGSNSGFTGKSLNLTGNIKDKDKSYELVAISNEAFKNMTLESLTLPSTITNIGKSAFADASIDVLHIPYTDLSAVTIDAEAFKVRNKNAAIVYVPKGSLSTYQQESEENLTVTDKWQDFTYILEEGGKFYNIEYEGNYKDASTTLPTKAPLGQLFPFLIDSIPNSTLEVTTTATASFFKYDKDSEKFAVRLINVPAGNTLTINIKVTPNPIEVIDNNKSITIESSDIYKEGSDVSKPFNGTINAKDIESLNIDGASPINIKVDGTTVKVNAATTVTAQTTATLTLSGANDLGSVKNEGTLTFEKGEITPTLGNTTINNLGSFMDNTGLIGEVTGNAPIKVENTGGVMGKEYEIEQGNSQPVTIEASSTDPTVTIGYAWQKRNEASAAWDNYTPTELRSSLGASVKLSEAGLYRCQVTSTKGTAPDPVTTSTLAAYITIKVNAVTPPEPPVYIPTYYTVSVPAVEGAILSVKCGNYAIEEGYNFRFKLTLEEGYDQSTPIVKANDEVVKLNSKGWYVIGAVAADQKITVTGVVKNTPTSIEEVDDAIAKVWATDGTLHIYTPKETDVRVINFSGSLVKTIKKASGDNRIDLLKGSYIVVIGSETFKIRL